jgi:hypothetical protein
MRWNKKRQTALAGCTSCICNPAKAGPAEPIPPSALVNARSRGASRGFFVSDQPPSLLEGMRWNKKRQTALAGCTSCICNPAKPTCRQVKKGPAEPIPPSALVNARSRGASRGFFVSDQPPSLLEGMRWNKKRQTALAGCTSCICNPAKAGPAEPIPPSALVNARSRGASRGFFVSDQPPSLLEGMRWNKKRQTALAGCTSCICNPAKPTCRQVKRVRRSQSRRVHW